jgi:type I restriction-modification system DNA methylase subunit
MIVRTIVEIVKPQEGMRIHDPTCGSSGMLIGCGRYVADHGDNQKNITLTGQERNYSTWAIGKLNMLLHNFPDADIQLGDTILNPKFVEGASLKKFDRILANPPFSLKEWHGQEPEPPKNEGDEPKLDRKKLVERFESDIYKRFTRGVPPTTKGDMAFLMHMVEACSDDGMIGVIMPHGVLFRSGSEGDIRKALLQEDLFEAVIGLPEKLFYGTGIPASILILNKNKPKDRKGHVLFVDASGEGFYHQGKNRNSLRWQDVLRIASVVEGWDKPKKVLGIADRISGEWVAAMEVHRTRQVERCTVPDLQAEIQAEFDKERDGYESARQAVHDWFTAKHPGGRSSWEKFAAVIPLTQIEKDNDFNLNISRYVDSTDPPTQLDVAAELRRLRELEARRDAAEAKMNLLLEELGYGK